MKQRTLIFTTSKKHWFAKDFEDIKRVQEQSKGLTCEKFDVSTINLKDLPVEKGDDGKVRPSWVWFVNNLTAQAQGYNQVVLHISKKDRKKFKISSNVGGTYRADKDKIIEFWMCADEGQKAKHYKGKSEFWRVFLHESAHGSERFLISPHTQLVHFYEYTLHDLESLYKLFNWTTWNSLYEAVTFQTVVMEAQATGDLLPLVKRKQKELIDECALQGIAIKVTGGFRTCEAQNALYAQGRTKPGAIVTNAKCGESLHNYGVSFDICFNTPKPYVGPWDKVGAIGESLGLEWGGRWTTFVDRPHFQLMLGYTLKDFQSKKVDYQKYK